MSWFKRNKRNEGREGLKHAFDEAGHTFYTFPSFEVAMARRYLAYIRLSRVHELGVSEEDLKVFCKAMRAANNKGDVSAVGNLIGTLEAYVSLYTDNKRVFEIANLFILVDDEPVEKFSEKHTILKRQLFKDHLPVRFFFIRTAERYIKALTDLPDDLKLEDYLTSKQVELVENLFSRSATKNL